MRKFLQNTRKSGYPLLLFLLTVSFSWGQGMEDFTNSNAGASYSNNSFIGNDGHTWTYVASRDKENASGIDGNALMLRRVADNSKVTSSTISGGIGDFSVKLYKGFTGGGDRQVELFVNGVSQGLSTPFDDYNEHIFEVNGIDIEGNIVIEIRNTTSRQVIVDDITWTSFGGGGNSGPFITNITQDPVNTTSSDAVMVSADLVDSDGIASAELHWGTASGSLTNPIAMSFNAGNTYTTNSAIPAQADGTTIFYEIQATDANAAPETTTSVEYSYIVSDPVPFNLPYFNAFGNQADYDGAVNDGFVFNNANQNGSYVHIISGSIVSPAIDFSAYGSLAVSFKSGTYGGGGELSVSVSNDNGANYTVLGTFAPTSSTPSAFEQIIDLTSLNGTNGRIKFEQTAGANSIRFKDLDISGVAPVAAIDYEFSNGTWSPTDPSGVSTASDDIYVFDGIANLTANTTANNLMIGADATLNVHNVLNLMGDLDIDADGDIVFTSTATSNGELGTVGGVIHGQATVQRYMSAKRSYRMVSSAVTTTTTIHDNWQEGATSSTDNPASGFGTHITGSTIDQENGFDATATGNSSMFTVNEADQAFEAIANTDATTMEAGEGYLLFVRGDRSTDLTTNNPTPSETVLRAKGTLAVGTVTQTFEMIAENHFAMFGNPYQSAVDMISVMATATNVNQNYYYVYDPTRGDLGSYVTVDLQSGPYDSANQYLQPGQAAQFASLGMGTSTLVFNESDKAPGNHTLTNRNSASNDMLTVQLYTTANFINGGPVHDSFGIIFAEDNDNAITPMDAIKPMNFNENFGIDNNGTYLSVERRAMPALGETYNLYSSGYNNTEYTLKAIVDGLEDTALFLNDSYTGNSTQLEAGEVVYSFMVDMNDALSIATDRFSIQVANRLGVENNGLMAGIQLYPNPISGNTFQINAPKLNGEEVSLSINDMLGREVYSAQHTFTANTLDVDLSQDLKSGVYLVTLSSNGETKTLRVIKR